MRVMEDALWAGGYRRILGMDEVGRGALAGPVTVAGVIFSPGAHLPGIRDSKAQSATRRSQADGVIRSAAVSYALASRDQDYIDQWGIIAAVKSCQMEIITKLAPDYLLLDAFALPEAHLPQTATVRGDSKSFTIAAASIVAKVYRDNFMTLIDDGYRHYGFAANKGYGTAQHRQALRQHGACALHRSSFLGFLGDVDA